MFGAHRARREPVEEAGEAARLVLAERELLEHAEADVVAPARAHHLLDMDVPRLEVVELLDLVLLGADRVLAVPAAVSPLGMRVAEAAHPEREQRLELDALFGAAVAEQAQGRALRPAQSGRPAHLGDRAGEVLDALLGRGAPRRDRRRRSRRARPGCRRSGRRCPLEAQEVRAAVVPVDRRPQEEDLRKRDVGCGGRRARRPGARPTSGPSSRRPRSIGISAPAATMRPDHVPHCVSRVESMTVFVPAVIVWRGSSSATVRAVNVTSASMPRSAASARTRVTRSGSTTSIVSGPILRLAAVGRGCGPTRTPNAARRRARLRTHRR